MHNPIKLVAVDIDGTFVHADYSYDAARFGRVLARMEQVGSRFVVASGNQYYQLRDLFPGCADRLAYVAENGAYVRDRDRLVFAARMPRPTVERVLEVCGAHPDIRMVMCGMRSAYCQRGSVSQAYFDYTRTWCHKLEWVDDLKAVDDQILKFAPTVPEEKTELYCDLLAQTLQGLVEPTSSGRGSIDLILPGCHKASGLRRLVELWGLTPDQCAAFGDGGNDVEMLRYCTHSYAMANAPDPVRRAARHVCPSNEEDGVLTTLEQLFF